MIKLIVFMFIFLLPAFAFALRDPFLQPKKKHFSEVFIPIHYADAAEISQNLNNRQLDLLSPQGKLSIDTRSNQIYVKDDERHLKKIKNYIRKIDFPLPQVQISAKIISIDNHYARNIGLIFKTDRSEKNSNFETEEFNLNTLQIPIIKFSNSSLLNLQIQALVEEGHANLLSKPEIITLNRQSASIESGEEIPYQESTSSGATNVTFKKAVLKLNVKPTILPHQDLLLNIQINEDRVSALRINGVPAIRTQQLMTSAMVRSGQTIVLGGIFENNKSQRDDGIPGLRKIPLLGNLMSRKTSQTDKKELLIFITPKILLP